MTKGLELKITTSELKKLFKTWQELPNKASLARPQFRASVKSRFEKVFAEDIQKRFLSSPSTTTGGKVYGDVTWRALSDSYLARRPDRLKGQVLIDTQRLKNSFVIGSSEMISELSNQNLYKFGTRVDYAAKLQKTWPIVFLHKELLDKITNTFVEWLLLDIKDRV